MEGRALKPMQLTGNVAENWRLWKRKFEIYSAAIELDAKSEKTQCAQLLFQMGEEVIDTVFNTFTFMDDEKDKIAKLIEKFDNYFLPKKNITYERHKFFTARQDKKTIEEFVLALKEQVQECNFQDHFLKTELIKSILIVGIKNEKLREHLLHQEYTLDKAVEVCNLTRFSTLHLPNKLDSPNQASSNKSNNENANLESCAGKQYEKELNITNCESSQSNSKLRYDVNQKMDIPKNHQITNMEGRLPIWEARPRATFRFNVPQLSKLKDLKDGNISPPCYVRNLLWKISVMFREEAREKFLGVFLQCSAKKNFKSWSCKARAELRLLTVGDDTIFFSKKIDHLFTPKEIDWGFSQFIKWNTVIAEKNGYIKNDTITIEVDLEADEPEGCFKLI